MDKIIKSGTFTTLVFIILQITGVTALSWWWILVTFFASPVAWAFGLAWLIAQII